MKKYIIIIFCLLLTGCFNFAGPTAPQKKYLLTVNYPVPKGKYLVSETLEILSAKALPQYAGREFVYRIGRSRYLTDYYHLFLVPITQQLTSVTEKYLRNKGLFKFVTSNNAIYGKTDYAILPTVEALYADYRQSDHPTAVIKVRFVLLDNMEKQHPVLLDKVYSQVIRLKAKTNAALITAWNQGLQNIMRQLSRNLTNILSD